MPMSLQDFLDTSSSTPEQLAARQRDRQRAQLLWPLSMLMFLVGVGVGAYFF